jgi:hypothetical protein
MGSAKLILIRQGEGYPRAGVVRLDFSFGKGEVSYSFRRISNSMLEDVLTVSY